MTETFYMIKDHNGVYDLDTISHSRNGTTDRLLGKKRGRLAWHRLYNKGYRIVRLNMRFK